jgi:hypothetical protein
MRVAAVLVAAAALAAHAPSARACTCPLPTLVTVPGDGAIDLALDSSITVIDADTSPMFELRDLTGAVVATTIDEHGDWRAVRPTAPLAPDTGYELYDLKPATPKKVMAFTTGELATTPPVDFGGLVELTASTYPVDANYDAPCTSSCVVAADGVVSQLELMFVNPPPTAAILELAVYRASDHHLLSTQRIDPDAHLIGFELCGPHAPAMTAGERYCAALTAYSFAGAKTGDTIEACSDAATCTLDADCGQPASCVAPMPRPTKSDDGGGCATGGSAGPLAMLAALGAVLARRRANR